jgi:NTP pyrophosphatase (non-canonical NTP hydrolase)
MLVSDYDTFVKETEQYANKADSDRKAISIFGLVGEIGSLISAVKKQMLGELPWDQPNAEIREELGDIMWYAFSVAQIVNTSPVNIFTINIADLKREMSGTAEHDRKVQAVLDGGNREQFLEAAKAFPRTAEMHFHDYQKLAYLTARTDGDVLMKVCLAVLWQLAAEMMRHYLPEIERELNRSVPDRPLNDILGDVAWHLSALASLVGLDLDDVAEANIRKVGFRGNRNDRTPLHDAGEPEQQQFPRRFDVVFLTVGPGRSRMYWNGQRLGDDLTDNAHDNDGYRFHDVMHLANIAHLGWSPVVRKMMDRRRHDPPKTKEVEDGGRAQVVEELIVKAIHTEGERLARVRHPGVPDAELRLFESRGDISFRLLQTLRNYADGLEVASNRFWEWEDAIFFGNELYDQLKRQRQGTVTVDLEARTLKYTPTVELDIQGALIGLAAGAIPNGADGGHIADVLRRTALKALQLEGSPAALAEIDVEIATGLPRLRVRGTVENALWARGGIVLRASLSEDGACTVAALADANIK